MKEHDVFEVHPGTYELRLRGDLDEIFHLLAVVREYQEACRKFQPFNSAHEAWATLFEEVDELWDEVKLKEPVWANQCKEAMQTAAMALRFMIDIGRKQS